MKDVIQAGDKRSINIVLRDFKTDNGLVKYESVLAIPFENRIANMAKKDFVQTSMIIVSAIHLAMESMNLKRSMTADQEIDLAEAIIDTSVEDWLALEDLMLFLQKLTRGEYGTLYESMDIPKFMEKFELYREDRHQNNIRIKEEIHIQRKKQGDTGRNTVPDELSEHFSSIGERISEMKSRISSLNEENKNLKMDNL